MNKSAKTSLRGRTIGRGVAAKVKKRLTPTATKTGNPMQKKFEAEAYRMKRSMTVAEAHEEWVKANIERTITKGMIGSTIGGIIGSVIPGVGNAAGAAIGNVAGNIVGGAANATVGAAGEDKQAQSEKPDAGKCNTKKPTLAKDDEEEETKKSVQDIVRSNVQKIIANKAFASQAQRGKFYAMKERGQISAKVVKEYENATPKDKKLPYKVKKD